MHENAILLFRKYALPYFTAGMKVLEIGPDFPSSYQAMVSAPNVTWHTLDIHGSPKLTYPNSDLYHFPVAENQYDIVLSGQVIEHVAHIWRWMPELARVTKPGGCVITTNPVSWPYHEAPIDCWRIYPEGLKALSEDSGLVVETSFWGSLETPKLRPFWVSEKTPILRYAILGKSMRQQHIVRQLPCRILCWFGGRVERSFDNITIARKPAAKPQAKA